MSLIGQSRYVGEPVAAVFAAIPVGVMRSIGVSLHARGDASMSSCDLRSRG
jgi:hypothetical protein